MLFSAHDAHGAHDAHDAHAAQDMFSSIDQLKTESHVDGQQSSFAHQLDMSQGGRLSCRGADGPGMARVL
jgi:hypothetical protein